MSQEDLRIMSEEDFAYLLDELRKDFNNFQDLPEESTPAAASTTNGEFFSVLEIALNIHRLVQEIYT